MKFYDKYVRKCIEIGKSPSAVAIEAGTTKTAVNRWKKGSLPSDATLVKLADYFGCSTDDLRGDDEIKTPATGSGDGYGGSAQSETRDEINRRLPRAPEWLQDQILSLLRAAESGRTSQDGDPKDA